MNASYSPKYSETSWSLHWLFVPDSPFPLLLTAVRRNTWTIFGILQCPSSELLKKELDHFAALWGYPNAIQTGTYFTNYTDYRSEFDAGLKQHGIFHTTISRSLPDSSFVDPTIERAFQQIVGGLHDTKQRSSNHWGEIASQRDVKTRVVVPVKTDPATRRMWMKMPSGQYREMDSSAVTRADHPAPRTRLQQERASPKLEALTSSLRAPGNRKVPASGILWSGASTPTPDLRSARVGEALKAREQILLLIRARGKWTDTNVGPVLTAEFGSFLFLYETPFQREMVNNRSPCAGGDPPIHI